LNTSNIHTHGLHVSPNAPSDSIFMRNEPNTSMNWLFDIPKNHMGGTHWYHPHLHHATASQAGGGAAGMIIVEDPPGSLPHYVEQMEEKILVFLVLDFALQSSIEEQGMGTHFWQSSSKSIAVTVNGEHQPKITVTQGKWYRFRMLFSSIELVLQMTNGGNAWCTTKLLSKDGVWLNVAPRDLTGWGRLRKPIPIQLGPANRADIAIACTCPFPKLGCYSEFYSLQNCTDEFLAINESDYQVERDNEAYDDTLHNISNPNLQPNYTPCDPWKNRRRRACEGKPATPMVGSWGPLQPPKCGFGHSVKDQGKSNLGPGLGNSEQNSFHGMNMQHLGHNMLDSFNGTIFSVLVEPSLMPRWWHPAWKFSVRRPCYLVDMRNAKVKEANSRHIEFWGAGYGEDTFTDKAGPIAVMFPGLSPEIPYQGMAMNSTIGDDKFVDPDPRFDPATPPPYGDALPMGEAIAYWFGAVAFHPFHVHVSPFQIQSFTGYPDDWLQVGDWQDTLLIARSNCVEPGKPCPLTEQQYTPPGAPFAGFAGTAEVRFWTDQYPGPYITHCHLLTHEDEGMMFYVNVNGTPGVVPKQAMELDPRCYNGHLKGWGFRWVSPWEALKQETSLMEEQQQKQKRKRRLRSARRHDFGETDDSAYMQMDSAWYEEDDEDEDEGEEDMQHGRSDDEL